LQEHPLQRSGAAVFCIGWSASRLPHGDRSVFAVMPPDHGGRGSEALSWNTPEATAQDAAPPLRENMFCDGPHRRGQIVHRTD